jgi:hypothetical protein
VVLHEKNGVITEERFQKMTTIQWLFHYREIKKFKDKESEKEKFLIELFKNYMELVGTMANPESGKKLQEAREVQQFKQEITPENFVEGWETLKKIIPPVLRVENKSKFFLPKVNRKRVRELGVKMKEGENNGHE